MGDWLNIKVKTEPSKLKHVQAQLTNFENGPVIKYLFQHLQYISASGADVGRNFIKYHPSVVTKTGEERASRGAGIAGRVDSGEMVNKFRWSGGKIGPGKYKFKVGWLDGTPGYAIFQEQGTKRGVVAMNALGYVTEYMRNEMKLMETGKSVRVKDSTPWAGED